MVAKYFKILSWHSPERQREYYSEESVDWSQTYAEEDTRQHSRYNGTNWSNGTRYSQERTSVSIVGRIEPGPISQPSPWSGKACLQDRILVSTVSRIELAIFRIEY
jgi:hypothetical protein